MKLLTLILIVSALLASCGRQTVDFDSVDINSKTPVTDIKTGTLIGDYNYPENPAQQLRDALFNDAAARGLAFTVSEVERLEFEGKECAQITVGFTKNSENLCVINFTVKNLDFGYDELFEGKENPSFTLLFKDLDNMQDMVMTLTSVLLYLSPDLNVEEAQRLANHQDQTLGTDGWSQPLDIGGYQVQARYTNPLVYANTQDFASKLAVTVKSIKQMWKGAINISLCSELKTAADYDVLTYEYPYWEEETDEPRIVYGDFIVDDISEHHSYLHGETWKIIKARSVTGRKFSFTLDTWEFTNPYEFGVGQRYTIFIRRDFNEGIIYAIQQSESAELNARGKLAPAEYPALDEPSPRDRIEPQTDGTIYDVSFEFNDRMIGDLYAAVEGHGLGEEQFLADPIRDEYEFEGWFDNMQWNGIAYTADTPIYRDTSLYAKWKYNGLGGAWPRAYHGNITDIDNNLMAGQSYTISAAGYNMILTSPDDQRFRWQPVSWRLSGGECGEFSAAAPYEATFTYDGSEQTLFITYREEIFDGIEWQKTGQLCEVPEKRI